MNKKQLIQSMASQLDIPQTQAKPQLEQILHVIHQGLSEGEKIYIPQFGTFELRFHLPKLAEIHKRVKPSRLTDLISQALKLHQH